MKLVSNSLFGTQSIWDHHTIHRGQTSYMNRTGGFIMRWSSQPFILKPCTKALTKDKCWLGFPLSVIPKWTLWYSSFPTQNMAFHYSPFCLRTGTLFNSYCPVRVLCSLLPIPDIDKSFVSSTTHIFPSILHSCTLLSTWLTLSWGWKQYILWKTGTFLQE